MRTRAQVMTAASLPSLLTRFKEGTRHTDPIMKAAAEYGMVLALTQSTDFDDASTYLRSLRQEYPGKITFIVAEAALHLKAERYDDAVDLLADAVTINPMNYPLSMTYAEALIKAGDAQKAEEILIKQSYVRPKDADLWYLLAETFGLANNIPGVHQARAEYFVLNGRLDQAITQLEYALPLTKENYQLNAKIVQRIRDIHEIRKKRL